MKRIALAVMLIVNMHFAFATGSEWYDHTTYPSQGAAGSSSAMRAELDLIEAGFGKLPTLSGNGSKITAINSGGTAMEAITTTGTGNGVRATSPTLTTPVLGVATATSINKVAITAPATSATVTIADGKTLTSSNTLTFAGTDGSTLNIGTGGTLGTAAYTATGDYAPAAGSSSITTVGTISSGTWDGTDVAVTAGGTGRSTSTTAYGLIAAGTTATGAHQTLAAGATTEILVGGGASALPVWTTATGTGAPVRAGSPTLTGDAVISGLTVGKGPGSNNTNNTAVGLDALDVNNLGAFNSAFGSGALYTNTNGDNNTAVGYGALLLNLTGSNNTAVGYSAGVAATGSDNILIGSSTALSAAANSNSIVIGKGATGNGSNTTVIGNASTTATELKGAVTVPSLIVTTTGAFTGAVSGPTAAQGTSTTQLATTAFVMSEFNKHRNVLLNGGFLVNQRGYASSGTLASGVYGHDGWKGGSGGGDYSFTQLNTSTTITIAANKTLIQVIENVNVHATAYVLAWTGTATCRYAVNSATPAGSYAASPVLISGQTVGTTMSIECGNGASTGTLGKVQLEEGVAATEFEAIPFADLLSRAHRYYEKSFAYATVPAQNAGVAGSYVFMAGRAGAASQFASIQFKAEKPNASYTFTFYNPSAANAQARDAGAAADCSSTAVITAGTNGIYFSTVGNASTVAGYPLQVQWTVEAGL